MDHAFLTACACIVQLSELLNMRFGSAGKPHPISTSTQRIFAYHNKHDYEQRDLEIGKVCMLTMHLRDIQTHDSELLAHFRKRAHRVRNWEEYFGWRMEVNVAATLSRSGVRFCKSESPDFTLNDGEAFIECGSIHYSSTRPKGETIIRKVLQAIQAKSRKPYCQEAAALALDATNIYWAIKKTGDAIQNTELRQLIQVLLDNGDSAFGSVMLFGYFMRLDHTFESDYLRIDSPQIASSLKALLNLCFPWGEHSTGVAWSPHQG